MDIFRSISARAVAGVIAHAVGLMGAAASTFEYHSQNRSITIVATLGIESYETGESESATDYDHDSATGFGRYDQAVGLSDFGLATGYGAMSGSGRVSQTSELSGEFLSFDGFTDVFVAGYSGSGGTARGAGSATTYFETEFSLGSPTLVELSMSSGYVDPTGEFLFNLAEQGGNTLWDQTYDLDENGMYLSTYTKNFVLGAGSYTLQSYLAANSWFEDSYGSAGQAVAHFTLTAQPTPIPEGGSIVAGVALATVALLQFLIPRWNTDLPKRRRLG